MKKLSWILIITLLASCLSACGRKETVIYQGDTASTSDATDHLRPMPQMTLSGISTTRFRVTRGL